MTPPSELAWEGRFSLPGFATDALDIEIDAEQAAEALERREDQAWAAFILAHHGLPPGWRIVDRRPRFITSTWKVGLDGRPGWCWWWRCCYHGPRRP